MLPWTSESPQERDRYLDEVCAGDRDLRQRVDRLLAAQVHAGSFLEHPAAEAEATVGRPDRESLGKQIGAYKLLQEIGEGGFGVVYMAEQMEPVRRKVALKMIKPGMDSREVVARFEAERQALAMMDHPNIAKVLDAGTTESGRPYFVMELIKGLPIDRLLRSERSHARSSGWICSSRSAVPYSMRIRRGSFTGTSSPATSW